MPPADLDRATRERFGWYQQATGTLEVPVTHDGAADAAAILHRDGVERRAGDYDLEALPALARAWRSGSVPRYGIVGEIGGARLTGIALETRLDEAGGMQVMAVARVLHPFPFQLQFQAAGAERVLEQVEIASSRWAPGLYYAKAELALPDNRWNGWNALRTQVSEDDGGWAAVTTTALRPVW